VISTAHVLLAVLLRAQDDCSQILHGLGLTHEAVSSAMEKLPLEPPRWTKSEGPRLAVKLNDALVAARDETWQRSGKKRLADRLHELHREKEQAVAKQDFERAARLRDEAEAIGEQLSGALPSVEPLDILLALLRQTDSAAVRIIQNLGLHPEQICAEVLRRLGEHDA
jgi:ATP-dependent Clp protease ATP-binding subunit ClpA